jgi:hypothetical protein
MNVTLMSVWTKKYYLVICEWIFESVALDERRWCDNEVFGDLWFSWLLVIMIGIFVGSNPDVNFVKEICICVLFF